MGRGKNSDGGRERERMVNVRGGGNGEMCRVNKRIVMVRE